ncbi:MAG TPA: hypothetical protein VGI39_21570 [Polyangiaceae bacterium]|jgi:hypothetical protein
MRLSTQFVSSFTLLAVLSASAPALAQDQSQPVQPVPYPNYNPQPGPPPPQSAVAPNGEYVAPMQQQTQTVYVPQSVAMTGPRKITDWDESQPIPPGYHVTTQVRKGLVIGGAVMFGVFWLLSALVAAGGDDGGLNNSALYVPAAGPFFQMGAGNQSQSSTTVLAIDGIAQCAGLAMTIFGIASPKTVLVRNDLGSLQFTPMKMGQNGMGWGLTGHF